MTYLGRRRSRRADDRPPVVLVGLDSLQGLQVARVLAARGLRIHAVAKDRRYHTCRTRVVESLSYCNTADERLITHLERLGPTFPTKAVLILCQDKSVSAASSGRDRLELWYHLMLPAAPVLDTLIDKVGFARYADSVGLPIPPTLEILSTETAREAASSLRFPVIVKPSFRSTEWMRYTKTKAVRVSAPDELVTLCDRLIQRVPSLIAQEWITGTDADHVTCNLFLDRTSKTIAGFTSQKIRQWPPTVGQGCLAVAVNDAEVFDLTRSFFEEAGHVGFGYLEFKRDRRTGALLAIEPNVGRPTGRSALAEKAGVDLHYAAYASAAGLPLPAALGPHVEQVKWVHLLRDLQASARLMRSRELTPLGWARSLAGVKAYAVLSARDPVPFAVAVAHSVPELLSKRSRSEP